MLTNRIETGINLGFDYSIAISKIENLRYINLSELILFLKDCEEHKKTISDIIPLFKKLKNSDL